MPTTPKDPPWPASTQDGAIVTASVTVSRSGEIVVAQPVVAPTWVDKDAGWQIRLVQADLENQDLPVTTRTALYQSLRRTKKVLADFIPD